LLKTSWSEMRIQTEIQFQWPAKVKLCC